MVLSDEGERKVPVEIVREGEAGRGRYRDVGEDREEGEGGGAAPRRGTWKVHFMGYHFAFDKKLIRI